MNFWLKVIGLAVFAYLVVVRLLKRVLNAYLPSLLGFFMNKMHYQIRVFKPKLFEEAFEHVNTNNKSGKLEILELGIGTGENFKCFPANSNITILDKTDIFLPSLEKSMSEHRSDLSVSKLVVCSAENMNSIESNSMDAVVHTFMLCSITDTKAVLNEIYRVLKPGGVFIFIDHAKDHESMIHRILKFLYKCIGGDRRLNQQRSMFKQIVKSEPFENLVIKDFRGLSGIFYIMNPLVYGYGIKSK